jgi:hypothetical protein
MNDNEVEIGMLKEKINMMTNGKWLKEKIKTDDNAERLRELYEYLKYRQRDKKRMKSLSRTEYAKHCKLEIDREIRELKKKGFKIEHENEWKRYGMRMLLAISKIKRLEELLSMHKDAS